MQTSDGEKKLNKKGIAKNGDAKQRRKDTSELFKFRKSLLEDLYEKGQLPIYNFIIPVMFIFTLVFMVFYCIIHGKSMYHFVFVVSVISQQNEKSHIVTLLIFVILASFILIFYPGFVLWSNLRLLFAKKKYIDKIALTLCTTYILTLTIWPLRSILTYKLSVIPKMSVMYAQLIFGMKCYSYLRENVPKVKAWTKLNDGKYLNGYKVEYWEPSFSKFCYFLSAPTYIYSDSYPRTKNINWRKLIHYVYGFLFSHALFFIPLVTVLTDVVEGCVAELTYFQKLVHLVSLFIITNIAILAVVQYGFIHCFYNAWAEITRFGDRQFYLAWWDATYDSEFIRKWAFPLYSWLHLYIYVDCRNVLLLNKQTAALFPFIVSSILHDLYFCICMEYFLPAYCCATVIYFVSSLFVPECKQNGLPANKIISATKMWICVAFFGYLNAYFHYLEVCVRRKCPITDNDSWNIVPRFLSC